VCSLSRTSLARPWVESGPQASAVADRQPDLVMWPKDQRRPNWPSTRCGRDASVTTCRSPVAARPSMSSRTTRRGPGGGSRTSVTWGRHRARSSVAWLTDQGGDIEAEEEL
jgi:hypothetical protein